MSVTDSVGILLGFFIFSIIPLLVIFYMLRRNGILANVSYKYFFISVGLIFLALIVIIIVSSFFYSDLENLQEQKERASEKFSERTQAVMKEKAAEREREAEEFESATVPSGSFGMEKLKYRPYWLVGDEWDEKERTGKIVKSQDCVDAVIMINDNLGSIQKAFYKAWLIECVKD